MSQPITDEQGVRERECLHRSRGATGTFYSGESYVQALQRMQVVAALHLSRKVGSFFWADAPRTTVWLCGDCAREAGLLPGN